ncbi:MAG: succinate--CoA ligase subunit alpha, partial [Campylobacteraceae bacterium]|nr:succinate--CoA ligase subunit alpha [Campylobacteraceae bacterium]
MSILLNDDTRVIVQGITGKIGRVQTKWMLDYGTNIVGGVTPGKGGQTMDGLPVFNYVDEAVKEMGATASVFFVPAAFVLDAFYETVDAGVELIVIVPEHIPVHDIMKMRQYIQNKNVTALGPTTPGILVPGKGKMGIMPAALFAPGKVGIISRSGTLSYEFAGILSDVNIGQSTVVGMGADPVVLCNLPNLLEMFENDDETNAVILVGEVGGEQEEKAADF